MTRGGLAGGALSGSSPSDLWGMNGRLGIELGCELGSDYGLRLGFGLGFGWGSGVGTACGSRIRIRILKLGSDSEYGSGIVP